MGGGRGRARRTAASSATPAARATTALSPSSSCGVPPDRAVRAEGGGKETPLIAACRHRRVKVAEALIDAGANPSQQTPDGASAMRIAKENKDKELMALLIALLKRGQNLVGHRVRVSGADRADDPRGGGGEPTRARDVPRPPVGRRARRPAAPHRCRVPPRLDEVLPACDAGLARRKWRRRVVAGGARRGRDEAGAGAASPHAAAALLHSPGGGADGDGSPRPHEALSCYRADRRGILLRACRAPTTT